MGFATRGLVTVPVVCHKPFARLATSIASILHDRSLSSVARDESRMARDKPRMTGDYCRPEESIPRCVRTHSHLYSYIYGLVALLDYIQSSFSIITIWTGYEPGARYNFYFTILNKSLKTPNPLTTIPAHQPQHHHHLSPSIVTFLTSSTLTTCQTKHLRPIMAMCPS